MIAVIDRDLQEVDKPVYLWFISKLIDPEEVNYANGNGWRLGQQLVAFEGNGKYYVRKNK